MTSRIQFAPGHPLAPLTDAERSAACAALFRERVGPHSPACDCAGCDAQYRQGRTLSSVNASSTWFALAALGIVALLVVALVMA